MVLVWAGIQASAYVWIWPIRARVAVKAAWSAMICWSEGESAGQQAASHFCRNKLDSPMYTCVGSVMFLRWFYFHFFLVVNVLDFYEFILNNQVSFLGMILLTEHIVSVIAAMVRNCSGTQRQRLLNKFVESDHEKVTSYSYSTVCKSF